MTARLGSIPMHFRHIDLNLLQVFIQDSALQLPQPLL
jgi:hypothetical protein